MIFGKAAGWAKARPAVLRFALLIFLLVPFLPAQSVIAFRDVTVVDVEHGALRSNQTVVIEGGRIAVVDDSSRARIPAAARVIPGKGKFLIPGLWDMHVHDFVSPRVPELFLANGVTGVRDMADDLAKIFDLRKAIQEHRRTGPRVVALRLVLNGVAESGRQAIVRTPAQARQVVRQQKAEGADFIKVYNGLSREAYFAVADECKRLGIPFVGHTPDAITTTEAAAAGQRSIEHLDGVLLDCSSNSSWLRKSQRFLPDRPMLDSFSAARANALFAAYVRYGVWHCPTLTVYRSMVWENDPKLMPDNPNVRYLPKEWHSNQAKPLFSDVALAQAVHRKTLEVTAMMFRAGVRLLAGTDTSYRYVYPGFGLHDELELMAAAGLPAPAVLRIATLNAAEFLGREKELGTVERGKIADLVLLDADPLLTIANTRQVRAVVADGRLYDRAALDQFLTPVTSRN